MRSSGGYYPAQGCGWFAVTASLLVFCGCATSERIGQMEPRRGDEIVVAGQFFHTGTPVVLWMDPGGYDAYRVERRFVPIEKSDWESSRTEVSTLQTPNRYGLRRGSLTPEQIEKVRGGGWDLPTLQGVVDQFVLHFDDCGTSRTCFKVLQDNRDLSVHFMLDLDGTIYQTLDLKERAFHATIANSRSVGVEIANIGAHQAERANVLAEWYRTNSDGRVFITLPERFGDGGIRTPGFIGHPARNEPVRGVIQGQDLIQFDYTTEQYEALTKLTAALCKIFPKIKCQYPRDEKGELIRRKLPDWDLSGYQGVLGHYHLQTNKVDPGPAMDWDRIIGGARQILKGNGTETAPRAMSPRVREQLGR